MLDMALLISGVVLSGGLIAVMRAYPKITQCVLGAGIVSGGIYLVTAFWFGWGPIPAGFAGAVVAFWLFAGRPGSMFDRYVTEPEEGDVPEVTTLKAVAEYFDENYLSEVQDAGLMAARREYEPVFRQFLKAR